jgi:hypothetical protein
MKTAVLLDEWKTLADRQFRVDLLVAVLRRRRFQDCIYQGFRIEWCVCSDGQSQHICLNVHISHVGVTAPELCACNRKYVALLTVIQAAVWITESSDVPLETQFLFVMPTSYQAWHLCGTETTTAQRVSSTAQLKFLPFALILIGHFLFSSVLSNLVCSYLLFLFCVCMT